MLVVVANIVVINESCNITTGFSALKNNNSKDGLC